MAVSDTVREALGSVVENAGGGKSSKAGGGPLAFIEMSELGTGAWRGMIGDGRLVGVEGDGNSGGSRRRKPAGSRSSGRRRPVRGSRRGCGVR